MNRKELIHVLATTIGNTKVDTDRNIAALIDFITNTLKQGDNVALVGFGTFEVRKRADHAGRIHKHRGGDQDQGIQGARIQGGDGS